MDDGSKKSKAITSGRSGFYLYTQNYTISEVLRLRIALYLNFNLLTTWSHKISDSGPIIHISSKSYARFRSLVLPYFVSSMLYK